MARLEIDIVGNLDELERAISNAESSLNKFASKAKSIGTNLSVAVTLPIVAIGSAAVSAASDFEEAGSKYQTVFRDISSEAEQTAKDLEDSFGLSSLASRQLLGDTGDLLTGFGFSQKAALDLSKQVNELAVDLASFTNFSGGAEGASKALTSALLGEREAVKSLGISILEEDVKQQVAINTAKGLTFETERQAKAYATLDIALRQSGNAIGDYARTSDSFANQQRQLRAEIQNVGIQLGEVLLPIVTKITKSITNVVRVFSELSDTTKVVIVAVAAVVAAIGPLLLAIGSIISLLPVLSAGLAALGPAITAATGPIGISVAAIAALTVGLFQLNSELQRTKQIAGEVRSERIENNFTEIKKEVEELAKRFKEINPNLTELEATNKAIDKVKESYKGLYLSQLQSGNLDADILNKQIQFLVNYQKEINKTDSEVQASLLTLEEFSKKQDELNRIEELRINEEIRLMNLNLQESINLINRVQEASKGITESFSFQAGTGGAQIKDFGIDLGDKAPISDGLSEEDRKVEEKTNAITNRLLEFDKQASSIINGNIANTFAGIADGIGKALSSGENVAGAIGKTLLTAVAEIAGQLGKLAISIGIGMISIKNAFSNPLTAIAAGTALLALSAFASSQANKIVGGGSSNFVASQTRDGQNIEGRGADLIQTSRLELEPVEFVLKGEDLVGSAKQVEKRNNVG